MISLRGPEQRGQMPRTQWVVCLIVAILLGIWTLVSLVRAVIYMFSGEIISI